MKSTHKTRPIEVFEFNKIAMLEKLREWQIWAETQEKELREILSKIGVTSRLYYFIKEELLGDKPKPYKRRKIAK